MFAVALACAAAVFLYFFSDYVFSFVDYVDPYGGVVAELILVVISIGAVLAVGACIWGLWRTLKTLKAGSRFSRLLRRPNDARTATVMASERGGRTLILDSNPRDGTGRGYQPLSEVRLALWLKAGMLMPGETVTVYADRRQERNVNQQRPAGPGVPRHDKEPVDRPPRVRTA